MWLIIGVSGATNSGKTTLARSLEKSFPGSVWICQDHYFRPVDSEHHILIPSLNHFNWEILSSIDMEKLHATIKSILSSDGTDVTSGNLLHNIKEATGLCLCAEMDKLNINLTSTENKCKEHLKDGKNISNEASTLSHNVSTEKLKSQGNAGNNIQKDTGVSILIIEGFIIFNDKKLADLCNLKYFITLNKEDCWERRKHRHYDPPDVPGYFDQCVWPEYEKHRDEVFDQVPDVTVIDGTLDKAIILEKVLLETIHAIKTLKTSGKL